MKYFKIIAIFITALLLNSCFASHYVGEANLDQFPKSNEEIDFNEKSIINPEKELFWNTKTTNEYYFYLDSYDETKLEEIIQKALRKKGYKIIFINTNENTIIGERGMRANEWYSIMAVYYKLTDKAEIYIVCKITQDASGGWSENRAMKIGRIIQKLYNK